MSTHFIQDPAPKNPVILIPGYFEPMLLFARIGRELQEAGWEPFGMDEHWPALRDIRTSAELLAAKIKEVRRVTGCDKVDLVSHSLGGLMGRFLIKFMDGERDVERLVTLATPHHGTYLAYLMPDAASRQMRPGSDFLAELNAGAEAHGSVQYTSVWTEMDQIVVPAASAHLDGADNHTLRHGFHNQMMFTRACSQLVLKALGDPEITIAVAEAPSPVLRSSDSVA